MFLVNFNISDDKFVNTYFLNHKVYVPSIVVELHAQLTCCNIVFILSQIIKKTKSIR